MFLDKKIKYLFKCKECKMILSIDLVDPEDIEKVQQDEMYLECPCGGTCSVLHN